MRTAAAALAVLGLALAAFGWWGVQTAAGQRRFDEMDGIIPAFAGFVGMAMLALAAVLALIATWRARRSPAAR